MNTLLDLIQDCQLKLYQYDKEKNELAKKIIEDKLYELEIVYEYLLLMEMPGNIYIPGHILIELKTIVEECNEIKDSINNIEYYMLTEFPNSFDELDEDDEEDIIKELETELDNRECLMFELLETYLNDDYRT